MSSPYHANQQSPPARPSSSKHASRSRGSSDADNAPSVATPPNHYPPSSNREMASRVANQAPVAAAPSEYQSHNPDRRRNMPPTAPPRTSSNQNPAGASESHRRSGPPNERSAAPPRHSRQPDGPRNGNVEDPAAEEARASGRRRQQMPQDPPPRASSSRDSRTGGNAPVPHRAAPPAQTGEDNVAHMDAATPPAVAMGDYGDQRRSGRSRHDNRTSKRDKETKFSDYILGNAIGEGEFGKVRLGWKAEDRVQVCWFDGVANDARLSSLCFAQL
ncbi:hypothetical protein IMZ48_20400 [Candidatus Bathyarchaeota archaeon]|nr:hypothetical protein [Candidatus Bathyarchaeota archaeon]